ncbi:hypothetical protein MP228_007502 [Amoeboaphelidium protococcarum]|nr:hypothetical protein MP228_007502 [Amoeboaphelidium protococcarum]
MYIKQIVIQGFKSYKDQTRIDPFSPKNNIIVGRNGSGKSNFFWAIRFVLNDAYPNMTKEERQALLHEGGGQATISAFVEIIFDNSDNRFPTNKEEVILRRTIGLKKDEYSLDRKSVPKSEVLSLLESAGFSRSNPYFIVPQGRVTAICNAKDSERLQLLKEVAGTRVYENKRSESLKIMEDTEAKRQKISEFLVYIEERLKELEEEKEELKQYYENDKCRRSIEYTIYSREQNEVNEQLEELEEERRNEMDGSFQRRAIAQERERDIAELEMQFRAQKEQLEMLKLQLQQQTDDIQDCVQKKAKMELNLRDAEEANDLQADEAVQLRVEMEQLDQKISEKEKQLDEVLPQFQNALEMEIAMKKQFDALSKKKDLLTARQGRANMFKTKQERDDYLKKQIQSVQKSLKVQMAEKAKLSKAVTKIQSEIDQIGDQSKEKEQHILQQKEKLSQVTNSWKALKQGRDELYEKRKDLWKREAQGEAALQVKRDEVKRCERNLASFMDKATKYGLDSVQKIVERLKLTGVHGPLYTLFEVDDAFSTAVDVVAGSSLFHVVVDNDETVSAILAILNKENSGRVTFMPLNRLKASQQKYPENVQAIPIISKLKFDSKFQLAFEQVFGKSVVCPSLEVASQVASDYGFNAITLDGDRVERRGALVGGYHDSKRLRLGIVKQLKSSKAAMLAQESQVQAVKDSLQSLESQCNTIQTQLANMERTRRQLMDTAGLKQNQALTAKELSNLQAGLQSKQKSLQQSMDAIQDLEQKLVAFGDELRSAWGSQAGDQSSDKLQPIVRDLAQMQKELQQLSENRILMENQKVALENELNLNLRRLREELRGRTAETSNLSLNASSQMSQQQNEDYQLKLAELQGCEDQLNEMMELKKTLEQKIDEISNNIATLSSEIDQKSNEFSDDVRYLDFQQKLVDKYLTKKAALNAKREECVQKIRELGALPEEAYIKYQEISSKKLVKELHKFNEILKKYAHVNKKAFEQYNNFTRQRDALIERKQELDESSASIHDLIKVLDQRKNEAMLNTFSQVEQHFAEMFEKLIPAGRGKLIIHRKDLGADSVDEADSFVGIGIQVSFSSKNDEGLLMQQLSGGQKSLVALALIFAIQKCDPAPFYLFDEIDANLDAAYRTSIAELVNELSQDAQFICTTFRPEMLRFADKFYGVTFVDRISRIQVISKEDATNFVEHEITA